MQAYKSGVKERSAWPHRRRRRRRPAEAAAAVPRGGRPCWRAAASDKSDRPGRCDPVVFRRLDAVARPHRCGSGPRVRGLARRVPRAWRGRRPGSGWRRFRGRRSTAGGRSRRTDEPVVDVAWFACRMRRGIILRESGRTRKVPAVRLSVSVSGIGTKERRDGQARSDKGEAVEVLSSTSKRHRSALKLRPLIPMPHPSKAFPVDRLRVRLRCWG